LTILAIAVVMSGRGISHNATRLLAETTSVHE